MKNDDFVGDESILEAINKLVGNIDFKAEYHYIISEVVNNTESFFTPEIVTRCKNVNLDVSDFNFNLAENLVEDENGKIFIEHKKCSADSRFNRVINVAVYEAINKALNEYVSQMEEFFKVNKPFLDLRPYIYKFSLAYHKNLRKAYNTCHESYPKDHYAMVEKFQGMTREEYIEFCIRVAILNNVILFLSDKSVYADMRPNSTNVI